MALVEATDNAYYVIVKGERIMAAFTAICAAAYLAGMVVWTVKGLRN